MKLIVLQFTFQGFENDALSGCTLFLQCLSKVLYDFKYKRTEYFLEKHWYMSFFLNKFFFRKSIIQGVQKTAVLVSTLLFQIVFSLHFDIFGINVTFLTDFMYKFTYLFSSVLVLLTFAKICLYVVKLKHFHIHFTHWKTIEFVCEENTNIIIVSSRTVG